MNPTCMLYHLARADFLERKRRYSFLITIGLTVYLVALYLPAMDASYLTLGLGHFRGIYNSAWVGSVAAVLCSTLLSLPGFYLVKNTIERDHHTGVGQILATSSMSKLGYVLGKIVSNFVFLAVMVLVVMVAAICMQLVRAESSHLEIWSYVQPLVFITLPTMALVSALAVLFETIVWLRGGVGNIIYFFLWIVTLIASFGGGSETGGRQPVNEPLGATIILASMTQTAFEIDPDYQGAFSIGAIVIREPVQTFQWDGVTWTIQTALWRVIWCGVAIGLSLIAALLFRRFDPAREKWKQMPVERPGQTAFGSSSERPKAQARILLTPLEGRGANGLAVFGRILLAELRLVFKGVRWWWYTVALGLVATCLFVPLETARQVVFPIAWIWPILLLSQMGNREHQHGTHQLINSGAYPMRRQFPALWCAGVIVCLVTGSGWALRSGMAGLWGAFFAWCVGTAFIPSLALVLGTWSGSAKLFEVIFVLLWYVGPMSRFTYLDFMGATDDAIAAGMPMIYLAMTAPLLALAVVGRHRKAQI
jgi:hypothetical protein